MLAGAGIPWWQREVRCSWCRKEHRRDGGGRGGGCGCRRGGGGATDLRCSACVQSRPQCDFSQAQRKKPATLRRCKLCLTGTPAAQPQLQPQPPASEYSISEDSGREETEPETEPELEPRVTVRGPAGELVAQLQVPIAAAATVADLQVNFTVCWLFWTKLQLDPVS
jgi:hypothetical protein